MCRCIGKVDTYIFALVVKPHAYTFINKFGVCDFAIRKHQGEVIAKLVVNGCQRKRPAKMLRLRDKITNSINEMKMKTYCFPSIGNTVS